MTPLPLGLDPFTPLLTDIKPGIVLLRNDTHPSPFDGLIGREYRLVYEDADHRLYIHKSIVNMPARRTP
jgi:hypothetical protein